MSLNYAGWAGYRIDPEGGIGQTPGLGGNPVLLRQVAMPPWIPSRGGRKGPPPRRLHLASDCTSCSNATANQFRLLVRSPTSQTPPETVPRSWCHAASLSPS
jgi:hypothetical protein